MTALFDRAYSLQASTAVLLAGLLIGYTATYEPKYCVLLVGGLALVVVTMLNLTIGIVMLTLGLIALAACALPARRATRVDPVAVLNQQ